MKAILLLPFAALPLLLTACETTVVERYPARRSGYVERDVVVERDHRHRADVVVERDYRRQPDVVVVNPRPRRNTVVVDTRPSYQPRTAVRYYTDARGRYYWQNGRKVYVR